MVSLSVCLQLLCNVTHIVTQTAWVKTLFTVQMHRNTHMHSTYLENTPNMAYKTHTQLCPTPSNSQSNHHTGPQGPQLVACMDLTLVSQTHHPPQTRVYLSQEWVSVLSCYSPSPPWSPASPPPSSRPCPPGTRWCWVGMDQATLSLARWRL